MGFYLRRRRVVLGSLESGLWSDLWMHASVDGLRSGWDVGAMSCHLFLLSTLLALVAECIAISS